MPSIKLIGFDLDETLTTNNSWVDLNQGMGITIAEDEELYRAHVSGELPYKDWLDKLTALYIKNGLASRKNIIDILKQYSLREGARELIIELKARGYYTAVISGSSDVMVNLIKADLGLDFGLSNNTLVFNEDDILVETVTVGLDTEAKNELLKQLCNSLSLDLTQCLYVGDGHNDLGIFASTGHGVTFRGMKIEDKAWRVIDHFSEILQLID